MVLFFWFILNVACHAKNKTKNNIEQSSPSSFSIVLTTQVKGSLEPCGCTSHPLGGLSKFAFFVEQKKKQGPVLLLNNGDFLFEKEILHTDEIPQQQQKANILANTYQSLGVFAQLPGAIDRAQNHQTFFKTLKNPWLLNHADTKLAFNFSIPIAVIAVTQAQDQDRIKARIQALKQQHASLFVIALSLLNWEQNQAFFGSIPDLQLIVSKGDIQPHTPIKIANAWMLDAGEQGQYAVNLDVFIKNQDLKFELDDQGEQERNATLRLIKALEQEIAQLEKQDPKNTNTISLKQHVLEQYKQSLQTFKIKKEPTGNYLNYHLIPFSKQDKESQNINQSMREYNRMLCQLASLFENTKDCQTTPIDTRYLGSSSCQNCHPKAYETWQKTKHAHAFNTLQQKEKQCDLSCIGCHSIGFKKPGGFCSVSQVGTLKDVGCESCHGPGEVHLNVLKNKSKDDLLFIRRPQVQVCQQCHTKEHSDLFNFNHYLPRILGPGHEQKQVP